MPPYSEGGIITSLSEACPEAKRLLRCIAREANEGDVAMESGREGGTKPELASSGGSCEFGADVRLKVGNAGDRFAVK